MSPFTVLCVVTAFTFVQFCTACVSCVLCKHFYCHCGLFLSLSRFHTSRIRDIVRVVHIFFSFCLYSLCIFCLFVYILFCKLMQYNAPIDDNFHMKPPNNMEHTHTHTASLRFIFIVNHIFYLNE